MKIVDLVGKVFAGAANQKRVKKPTVEPDFRSGETQKWNINWES